jgi:hypothetical protein
LERVVGCAIAERLLETAFSVSSGVRGRVKPMRRLLSFLTGFVLCFVMGLALAAATGFVLAAFRLRALLVAHPGLGTMAQISPRSLLAVAGAAALVALALLAVTIIIVVLGRRRPSPASPSPRGIPAGDRRRRLMGIHRA